MLYSFSKTSDSINGTLTVSSNDSLAFVYETIALAEKADVKIENMNDEQLAAVYDEVGVQTNFYDNTLFLSKKPLNISGTLIKDLSATPLLAFPFAIVCAAKGILADLKGLDTFTQEKGADVISLFQKEMYRFHINTDFCDHSKLKIYNNKELQPKTKPVHITGADFLSTSFIPLVITFGKIEIEMVHDFEETNKEVISLLAPLNIVLEKR